MIAMNNMGPRNLLILFFSTVAVSLVILIIFFSLFFKNVDLNFNAKLPESAPDLGNLYGKQEETMQSKAEGLLRATINVPPEVKEFVGNLTNSNKSNTEQTDVDLPPVSDDVVFEDAPMKNSVIEHAPSPGRTQVERPVERRANNNPVDPLEPAPDIQAENNSGPPVPGGG
jgi:hypothetical protein